MVRRVRRISGPRGGGVWLLGTALAVLAVSCGAAEKKGSGGAAASAVREVTSIEQLKTLLDTSGSRLLVFDLYADWCMPCRILSPMIEKIALEQKDKASFFKVNIDKQPEIGGAFGVQGIPFVVFVRGSTGLDALTGLHPPETYVRLINRLSAEEDPGVNVDTPNGLLEEGVRIIRLTPEMAIGNVYVYRGETVRIVMEKVPFAYAISIPRYKASGAAQKGEAIDVTFKADEVGVFPVFCNGDCPTGDGSSFGQVIVMPYQGSKGSSFAELSVAQAREMLKGASPPLLLDVRTPNEYYAGHIDGAQLVPLQQLEGRVAELQPYKSKPVLLYCRSGNRSTVAAEILARHGFTTLYHLRPGLKGWEAEKLPVVRSKSK